MSSTDNILDEAEKFLDNLPEEIKEALEKDEYGIKAEHDDLRSTVAPEHLELFDNAYSIWCSGEYIAYELAGKEKNIEQVKTEFNRLKSIIRYFEEKLANVA